MDKDILKVTEEIGKAFEGTTVCGDCPIARCRTVTVAHLRSTIYSKQAGCCSGCASSGGYLHAPSKMQESEFKQKLKELQDKFGWDMMLGFFDMDKKVCKLPRYYRSYTCQQYNCEYLAKEVDKKVPGSNLMSDVSKICNKLKNLREKLGELI